MRRTENLVFAVLASVLCLLCIESRRSSPAPAPAPTTSVGVSTVVLLGDQDAVPKDDRQSLLQGRRASRVFTVKEVAKLLRHAKPTWSKPKLGVQLGLCMAKPRAKVRIGETVQIILLVRNNGPKTVDVRLDGSHHQAVPKVVNQRGQEVQFSQSLASFQPPSSQATLAAGEIFAVRSQTFFLGTREDEKGFPLYWQRPAIGKHTLSHRESLGLKFGSQQADHRRVDFISGKMQIDVVLKQ